MYTISSFEVIKNIEGFLTDFVDLLNLRQLVALLFDILFNSNGLELKCTLKELQFEPNRSPLRRVV